MIHVAAWAARFLFTSEQLNQPVGRLSGGERARVLIAQLMLQPADVLLLDEPTNDLDIPTLEILEESLLEFTGALVLVTHDRYMLDRVSNIVHRPWMGRVDAEPFADYSQWEQWQRERTQQTEKLRRPEGEAQQQQAPAKKKLSYLEAREYATLEERIARGRAGCWRQDRRRQTIRRLRAMRRNCSRLMLKWKRHRKNVDALFARWAELEEKLQ